MTLLNKDQLIDFATITGYKSVSNGSTLPDEYLADMALVNAFNLGKQIAKERELFKALRAA